jgi:EAL domain-containing protein (putative c-di-GMP-specific phosphodiesterase class I)
VRALNDVAKGLSKQVVAEWVESPEALKLLIEMGAQYGQGFMFRKPVPIEDTVQTATNRLLRAKAGSAA